MSDPVIDVRNLQVSFTTFEGTARVLNGVDFTVDRHQKVAIIGETGCGKSVTAKTILGVLEGANVESGEVYFQGEDLLALSDAERRKLRGEGLNMIPQDPMASLNPVFTVGEQMMDLLKWQSVDHISPTDYIRDKFADHSDLRRRALDMLEAVEISAPEHVFRSYPVELSGGMRQRVLIAMSLLSEPALLIADEPGTALDVTTESKVLELLDRLVEDTDAAMLYITHDLRVARAVADYGIVMYAGDIVEQAPIETLFDAPQHPYTRGLLESFPKLTGDIGEGIPGEVPSYTGSLPACRFADRCPYAHDECREFYPYRRLTAADHEVACHLHDGPPAESRFEPLYTDDKVDIGSPPWLGDAEAAGPEPVVSAEGGTDAS